MKNREKIGVQVIKSFVKEAPGSSGVYRMMSETQEILYIGKAKNLKKRINSYTNLQKLPPRLQKMVSQVAKVEITTTKTESEALLLEANLIKHHQPKYNIELKDNKSFPYIAVDDGHDFPRIYKHRGTKKKGVSYFGPYASAGDVNRVIAILQRSFLLRPCADSVFSNRTRPCLEYQIKRCSAPCVGKIKKEDYAALVSEANEFLNGKSRRIQQNLEKKMMLASEQMDYERAAIFRDRIKALTQIQGKQYINAKTITDADVLALHNHEGKSCIQVFFFRGGQSLGNKAYFPRKTEGFSDEQVLEAFLIQFYQTNEPPKEIILGTKLFGSKVIEQALYELYNQRVKLMFPLKGEKLRLVQLASDNAKEALERKSGEDANQRELLEGLAKLFDLDETPKRIEVFDNSHISGTHQVGAMIVGGEEGFVKNSYRKFNIKGFSVQKKADQTPQQVRGDNGGVRGDKSEQGERSLSGGGASNISPGDDYSMMREVLTRRYSKIHENDFQRPDLVLIDGGPGHLSVAEEVFADLGITDLPFVCISKGPDRNAGREKFHQPGKEMFQLELNDPVLFYLQILRDEAHRFAIMTHRAKRSKAISKSVLDDIEGIGATRKKALLHHFGSATAVEKAGIDDLVSVEGISKKLAKQIYDQLH